METLVATVLIVIIFMISSMVLNNIIITNIKHNTEKIEERMHKLEYEFMHNAIQLPYQEDFEMWEISISNNSRQKSEIVLLEAINSKTGMSFSKPLLGEN